MIKDTSKDTSFEYPQLDEDFSLVSGGLIYSLMTSIRVLNKGKHPRRRRAIAFAAMTWVPLLILASIAGTLTGDLIEINFLEDFTIHIRFLFVVPFLILIEKRIDNSFIEYIKTTGFLIGKEQQARFGKIVSNINRLSNSYIPEILSLFVIYLLVVLNWNELSIFENTREFLTHEDTNKLSPAGWCFLLFSFPVYQLLVLRWIWRWFIWAYSVIAFSRLQFRIEAVHYDQMAGLAYLNLTPFKFSLIFIAFSTTLVARIGFEIIFDDASLTTYLVDILLYLVAVPLLLYGPLLFYTHTLMDTKAKAIHHFGNLLTKHNVDFMNKWVDGPPPKNEPTLGSLDNSSLNDINGSYGPVNDLKIIPWNFRMLGTSMVVILLPFIPLLFTFYSASELLTKLFDMLFGA